MNRECKACEGTGYPFTAQWTDSNDGPRCVPCQGSGRISERIPASDAIADAETLRRVAHAISAHCYLYGQNERTCETCDAAILAIRIYNPFTDQGQANTSFFVDPLAHAADLMARCGQDEARAAFRAVPGLRA